MIDLLSTNARRRYTYYLHTLSNGARVYVIAYIDENGEELARRHTSNLSEARQFVERINRAIVRHDSENEGVPA
jgi:hypothetical protein